MHAVQVARALSRAAASWRWASGTSRPGLGGQALDRFGEGRALGRMTKVMASPCAPQPKQWKWSS
jgi:hypothetical protein